MQVAQAMETRDAIASLLMTVVALSMVHQLQQCRIRRMGQRTRCLTDDPKRLPQLTMLHFTAHHAA
jgi:hypothetical protein